MKVLLLPLLEGLLWFLRLLPRKPQPSQVRDTQAEEDEIWELMQPVQAASCLRQRSKPVQADRKNTGRQSKGVTCVHT